MTQQNPKRFQSLCPVCRSEVTLYCGMGADAYLCPNKCKFLNDDVIVRLRPTLVGMASPFTGNQSYESPAPYCASRLDAGHRSGS